MAFLESIARQAAIKLATGQLSPEQVASVTAFNLGERAIVKEATVPLEQIIAEERAHQEEKASSPLNKVGDFLRPIVSSGLAAVANIAAPALGGKVVSLIAEDKPSTAMTVQQLDQLSAAIAPRSAPMFDDIVLPGGGTSGGFSLPSVDFGSILTNVANIALIDRAQREQAKLMATPAAFPGLPAIMGGAMRLGTAALPALGGAVVRAGSRLIGGVTRKKAVALAKVLGVQGAATALGIGAVELADAVLSERTKARRGAGISGAQLRTTRKTIGKVMRAHRFIVHSCNGVRGPARRAPKAAPIRVVKCK